MLLGLIPAIGTTEIMVFMAYLGLLVWPAWRICAKAGFPGPLGLLAIVPGLNLALLFVLAYVEWPALRRERAEADRAA